MDFRFAGGLVGGYKLSYFEFIMLIAELDEVSTAILGGEAAENERAEQRRRIIA